METCTHRGRKSFQSEREGGGERERDRLRENKRKMIAIGRLNGE